MVVVENDETVRSIEIEESVEGGIEEVFNDYYFQKIGKPIPIVNGDSTIFDLQSLPTRPLAVSEVHRLIFLAHPSGFFVARTKDVMDAAKEIEAKGTTTSIGDLSIANVSIGKVSILSLSSDSSTLAACVDAVVHFFGIDSLLKKDLKPLSSCSLSDSSATIKDMLWRSRADTSYLVLSDHGKLFLGALGAPLKDVMDNVDAVEWSLKGKYIAVARENNLHIFSSKFKERLRISLPFKLWIGDTDDKCSVKVDSIRWVCPDSIVLGCFQQLEDGKEENYFIQVIKSKDGRITDASSKLSVLSFYDMFSGLIDDIVPYGSGPYLFLSYLKQCGIAITANRKNTDRHIMLLHWSQQDDTSEVGVIEIDRDMWIPRIELQGNGDDDMILGLCVDNVSLYETVRVEEKELSPSCALFCVTLEGKLVIFYFASASGPTISPEADSSLCDEEEDSLPDVAAGHTPLHLGERTFDQVALGSQLNDVSKWEPNMITGNEILTKTDLIPSSKSENSMNVVVPGIFHKDVISEGHNVESLLNLKPSAADGKDKVPVSELFQGLAGQQKDVFGQQGTQLEQSSLKNSLKHPSIAEAEKITELKPSRVAFLEKAPTFPSQSRGRDLEKSADLPKASLNHITSTALQSSSTQPWSSGKPIFSGGSDSRPFFSSSSSQGLKSDNAGNSFETGFFSAPLAGKPFLPKDSIGESPSTNISVSQTQIVGPKASMRTGKIDSLPSIRSLQLPSQEISDFGRSTNYKSYSSKESHRAISASSSEPHLSRQFGNIKEMTSELDTLLESIERPGGFRDACTVSKRISVEALEERMKTLSGKCRTWKSLMDGQLEETQNLLDKTVQVLARKIYMDGIVKQATDSKYWELWDRQKLGSEFDLKRRRILKLNQVLTNQLIELERHFNTLELQKFGENAGAHTGRRAFHSRYEPSRQIQSLRSLHNTTNSQLTAAEQLSECLTKQMEVLRIQSPVKQKNVKQELFESIGIPYDPTFSSPDAMKVRDSSPSKKLLVSGSAVNKSQSRRRLSSAMKSSDSETARRRRESLDQSWASFEPTKTTIKRVLLQESPKTGTNTSSLKNRHQFDLSAEDRSARLMSPPTVMNQFGNRGIQHAPPEQAFGAKTSPSNWGNASLPPSQQLTTQASGLRSSVLASQSAFTTGHTGSFAADKSSDKIIRRPDNVLINETKSFQQSEAASHKKSSFSMEFPAQIPVLTKPSEMLNSGVKGNVLTNITADTKGTFTKSFSLQTAAAPVDPSHFGEVPRFSITASKSQSSGKSSFSQAFSTSLSVPSSNTGSSVFNLSSSTLSNSAAMPFGMSMGSSKADTGAKQIVSLTPSSVSSPVFPSSSFSLQSGSTKTPSPVDTTHLSSISESLKTQVQLPPATASLTPPSSSDSSKPVLQPATVKTSASADSTSTVTTEPPKAQLQHFADKASSRTDVDTDTTALQAPEPPGFSLKVEPPVSSSPRTETSTALKVEHAVSSAPRTEISTLGSGIQPSSNSMTGPGTGLGLNMQPDARGLFSASLTSDSAAPGGSANLDVPEVTEEDEMEEEAPETNQTNGISLGSLGGFGLGSTPSPNVPKANPFGNPFGTIGTNQASSPFSMSVPSGELFRPASFSFQSPQPAQPSPPQNLGAVSGGFGSGAVGQAPAPTFGQPAQIGAGQAALGSVLGSFGQSRQFGAGLPGGFASTSSMGGFSSAAATGGGFATVASNRGGFAGLASAGGGFGGAASGGSGGFAGAASGGGGFAGAAASGGGGGFAGAASGGGGFAGAASGGGGGFAGAASGGGGFAGAPSGGGFGAPGGFGGFGNQPSGFGNQPGFSAFGGNSGGNQQGSGGFSSFGGSGKPSELFTQMRK
ncbi:nuclear pore complex protein NUP214 isoform X2 [Euphorbia lathyris]|uniref:nuclear pore complex protein NUP214 isoform X2 n=1 Tax=Euphorbia lathyris TaxID=212925 RepID=UPI003313A2B1